MRKKEIKTIQDWRSKLFIIFDDFFGTDLWMHKKGIIYEKIFYCKSTIIRLKMLFDSIKKIIEKSNYRKLIEELKKPEEEYLRKEKEEEEKWLGKQRPLRVYIPEKAKEYITLALYIQICRKVLETLENNEIEKTNFDLVLRVTIKVMKIMQERFRKELNDYGYIIRKEKKVKYLRKK